MGDQEPVPEEGTADCGDWTPPRELQAQWQFAPRVVRSQDEQYLLASIIENEVIPRLLLANRSELAIAPPASDQMAAKLAERIGELAELVINEDESVSIAYLETLRKEGASIEGLFQDLLAPTARRLGELWDEDINDFLDVTRGIGHLQQIVRAFSREFCEEIRRPLSNKRALLMPLPGEQHTLGISLLREHFLREGWRIWCGPCTSIDEVVTLVKSQWFDMVGLSASILKYPEKLANDIRLIRDASINTHIHIFVGGHAFDMQPGLTAAVGADATARDGRQAVLQASMAITKAQPGDKRGL